MLEAFIILERLKRDPAGMTNRRREVVMRYRTEHDATVKGGSISEDDTPKSILLKLKAQPNFRIADEGRHPFGNDDSLFGYCTFTVNPPVMLLHASALTSDKDRVKTPKKDHRIATELRCGDSKTTFARGVHPTYAKAVVDAKGMFGITDPCFIEKVRAQEDRIIILVLINGNRAFSESLRDQKWRLSQAELFLAK
jgi:hypothetical protein